MARLTDIRLRSLKPTDKVYRVAAGGGLCIEVQPNGSKLWRYRYRFNGKATMISLGENSAYPACSLNDARRRHADLRALVLAGTDPSDRRRANKRAAQEQQANTFAGWAEAWYGRKAPSWAQSTADKVRFYLDQDLLPALGSRPIESIKRPDLVATLRSIEDRGAFNVVKKARGWLSGIFRYALVAGAIEATPATDLDVVAAAGVPRRHHAHISSSELPAFLRALEGYDGHPTTRLAIKLLLLTAVRPGELRHAPWSEFDLDRALWSIPADRMKMRRAHIVPLPDQAVAILRALHQLNGHRDLLFPSRLDPRRAISENTLNMAMARIGYKGRQTGHGFRHLISTALNERGYSGDWIERQLAHGDENEIRAIYNKAEYLDQRREMMQAWADYLDALRDDRKIVAGKFGRAA